MKHQRKEEGRARVPMRVQWALWGALRVLATLAVGVFATGLITFWVMPMMGAAIVMNAGVTGSMNILTGLVMVLVPELVFAGVMVAFVIWVTKGVWAALGRRQTACSKERES